MKINKNLFKRMISRIYIGFVPILFIVLFLCMKPAVKSIIVKSDKYKTPANSYFTDMNFYKCVINGYNNAMSFGVGDPVSYDTNLSDEQLGKITSLHCSGKSNDSSTRVKNVDGIEKLTSLVFFDIFESDISEMDLSHNTNLVSLDSYNSNLSSIDLSHNIKLSHLRIEGNRGNSLSEIDLSHNTELTYLNITFNKISDIDLQFNKNLESLYLNNNQLNNIDLSHNIALKNLNLSENNLEEINLENNTLLEELNISYNELSDIDLSHNIALKKLNLFRNKFDDVNLEYNTLLKELDLSYNKLSVIDLSHNLDLQKLGLHHNYLSDIDLSNNTKLKYLILGDSSSGLNNYITSINLEHNPLLRSLELNYTELSDIDLSHNPDLISLILRNNKIENVDLSHNPNLKFLDLSNNKIKTVNLNNNVLLEELSLNNNYLEDIDLSHNPDLTKLSLFYNRIKYIDLSHNPNLNDVYLNHQKKWYVIYKKELSNINEQELKDAINSDDLKENYTLQYDYVDKDGSIKKIDFDYDIDSAKITSRFMINDEGSYIYIGANDFYSVYGDVNLRSTSLNGVKSEISGYKYIIKYANDYKIDIFGSIYHTDGESNYDVVKEFDIVNISSDKYDLSGDSVNLSDNDIQTFLNNITCNNCNAYIYDGTNNLTTGVFGNNYTLRIMRGNDLLKEFSINSPVSGVNIVEESISLNKYDNKTLNVEFTPNDAYNKEVIWESSNPSVATVENGVVTAVGVGNATITVKTVYGEFTDTCNVTVTEPVKHNVVYKKPDGTVFKTLQFLPGENVIQKFDEIFYFQGKKFIGWIYSDDTSSKTYTLDKSFPMPNNDIELVAQYADVMFGNLEYDVDINDNNKYLSGIDLETDVNDLDNLDLDSNYKIKVFKSDGETLKTSGNVGTGDVIKVFVNNNQDYLVETYTVVIKGDNNGDGKLLAGDIVTIYNYFFDGFPNYVSKVAADYNNDGRNLAGDVVAMYNEMFD